MDADEHLVNSALALVLAGNYATALLALEPALPVLEESLYAKANTLIGFSCFSIGNYEKAFLSLGTPYVVPLEGLSRETLAQALALSALGSGDDLNALIALLTDYSISPLSSFFDLDFFVHLREVGNDLAKCQFGKALRSATAIHSGIEVALRRKLFAQMIKCFKSVELSELTKEFHTTPEVTVQIISELIQAKILPDYRLDFLTQQVLCLDHKAKLEIIQRETNQALTDTFEQLKLAKLRIMMDKLSIHSATSVHNSD